MANGNLIEFINADIEAIKKYNNDIAKTYVFIARRLYELKESGYIETTNYKEYKNIYDLSLHEFGYEKAKTNYLILIYIRFFKDFMLNHVKSKYQEYSVTQLRYMLDMTEEQINQCNSDMSVRAIKEIKLKLSTRVDNETVVKADILKNQTVITGVFPDKKQEEKEEEKQKTIIISELPNPAPAAHEEKTVTTITETITSQNLDFETNNSQFNQFEYLKGLENEIIKLRSKADNYKYILDYFHSELYNINNPIQNDKIDKLCCEVYDFIHNNKMPKKVQFMQNVI